MVTMDIKEKVQTQFKDKWSVVAAATYFIFFLPRFTQYKTDQDMHFHMRQGAGLLIAALTLQGAISILGYWGMPTWRVWPVRIILIYWLWIGISNAFAHRKDFLPWIGEYADRAF